MAALLILIPVQICIHGLEYLKLSDTKVFDIKLPILLMLFWMLSAQFVSRRQDPEVRVHHAMYLSFFYKICRALRNLCKRTQPQPSTEKEKI
jgi:hypothetical protein